MRKIVKRNPMVRVLRDPKFRSKTVKNVKGKGSYSRKGKCKASL